MPKGLLTVDCAGVPITACTPADAVQFVIDSATAGGHGSDIHLCNAYTLALADKDGEYREMLGRATANFPDGTPVVWANRIRHRGAGVPKDRVRGPSLFLNVFEAGQAVGLKHYLLGSTPDVLQELERNLRAQYSDADIVGLESPPFRALSGSELNKQAERIHASGAQVVWVGLGTPKQDWECARLRELVPAVFVAVGAAFDFAAGTKSTAPEWMQNYGLEWAHRLASEPGRLWKRYLFGNARFVVAATHRRR